METYEVEKWVWTEADFEFMNWHDSPIYALAFFPDEFEIVFDIDYILQWIHPQLDEEHFRFWISPATLVFENVYDIQFHIDSSGGELDILEIKREEARSPRNAQYIGKETEWLWTIECLQGEVKCRSTGYKQYLRTAPLLGRSLKLKPRNQSFARGKIGELP